MSITAPDPRLDSLHDPDWRAFEDELAPICDELAGRYAREYDDSRRRRDFDERLADIRRRDAERRAEHDASSPFDF